MRQDLEPAATAALGGFGRVLSGILWLGPSSEWTTLIPSGRNWFLATVGSPQ